MTVTLIVSIMTALLFAWLCYGPLPTFFYKYLRKETLQIPDADTQKLLLLTFDDGPDQKYTQVLLQLLAEQNIHALFFSVTEKALKYPLVIQNMQANGHSIGLHGNKHNNMWFLTRRQTKKTFTQGLHDLAALGITPIFYRPPYGSINLFTLYYCRRYRLTPLLWTTIVQDWKKTAPELLLERLRQRSGAGSIILLHDSGEDTGGEPDAADCTICALRHWLPEMQAKAYKFAEPAALASTRQSTKASIQAAAKV